MRNLFNRPKLHDHHPPNVQQEQPTILIGLDLETGEATGIPLSVFSRTHLHGLGSSGSGKTRLVLHINRQFLACQLPFTQFDVEGPLHDDTMNFLAHHPHLADQVVEFNLSSPQGMWCGFNPLARFAWSPRMSVQVEWLLAAFAKVWTEESKSTPLLRRMLRNIFFPLMEAGLTPMEADYFLDLGKSAARRRLGEKTSNRRVKRDWGYFNNLTPSRQLEQLGSTANRMADFVDSEALQFVMRQANVLDIQDIVENRKTLLVNLSQQGGWLSQDGAFLVAALLLTLFVSYAMTRSEEAGKARPYFLILDEFQNFITPDIARILDQCRKRGLYIIFAHQHLTQIAEQDVWTYHSVLQNARIKCIFSLDDQQDLETMEEIIFRGTHDLKRIKHQSFSGQEATTPAYWDLPELRYQNQTKIGELPRQTMVLKLENQHYQVVQVATVEDYAPDAAKLQAVREIIWSANPQYYLTENQVLAEIEARRSGLEHNPDTDDAEDYLDRDE